MKDPTQRFSDRVEDYVKYRPSYPPEVIELLRDRCRLAPPAAIADIGSGTGILARLLLDHGYRVYGVEPNGPMREAAERLLAGFTDFVSVDGRAEATGLPEQCVDGVTAAQAFHWFDRVRARIEFERILQPGGWVILVWNDRRTGASAFQQAYEELLREYAKDYRMVRASNVSREHLAEFFHPGSFDSITFESRQCFDLGGLSGRLLSASYAPKKDQPRHAEMMAELAKIFEAHHADGLITFDYDTHVHYGRFVALT